MRKLFLAFVCAVALLVPSSQALAGNCSSCDEYTEHIPSAGGSHNGGESGNQHGSIPPGTRNQMNQQGPAGTAAASLAESTAPGSASGGGSGGKGHAGQGGGKDNSQSGSSGGGAGGGGSSGDSGGGSSLSSAVSGATGQDSGGGMGVALPIILGASLFTALGALALRRRGSSLAE